MLDAVIVDNDDQAQAQIGRVGCDGERHEWVPTGPSTLVLVCQVSPRLVPRSLALGQLGHQGLVQLTGRRFDLVGSFAVDSVPDFPAELEVPGQRLLDDDGGQQAGRISESVSSARLSPQMCGKLTSG